MNSEKVAEIYAANQRAREKVIAAVKDLSAERSLSPLEGEKWSIAQVTEHIAMVADAAARICAKLLGQSEAADVESDADTAFSDTFLTKSKEIAAIKLQAPERVQPVGGQSIEQSLAKLTAVSSRFDELRPLFEQYDCREQTFPHPFFGELNAGEWLALAGLHAERHVKQVESLKSKLRP